MFGIVIDVKLLIENTCAFIQKRANTSCEGRAAAGLERQLSPQISEHLSSPHTHLNQASCSRVSHGKRTPPDRLNCLSAALRRCCQASNSTLRYTSM